MEIDQVLVEKVLGLIDHGLVKGVGNPIPGQMCIEAVICYALDLPHGDDPGCVLDSLRQFKIRMNDRPAASNQSRAQRLRRLGIIQIGTKDSVDEVAFVTGLAELAKQWVKSANTASANAAAAKSAAAKSAADAKFAADASDAAYDEVLAKCCEDVVQLLIRLKAPAAKWLYLTE